ncbi:ABC transporter substrate-binding protein [Paenirhodobacter populi]|uniref:ABC transporter substrate-binding protein n=1 Tax=Paenirhodobacter populi TaxID=2306993 RepID=UPI000FE2FFA0|nr:extracellular solute-binding protein [Sinirhodobacter populi]RWR05363.1 extracellular solute-binding protein [Sinirhodobacter populi]
MREPLRLRVISRGEFVPPQIRARLARDLDFDIEFIVLDSTRSLQQVMTEPESFDVYHQWHTSDLIWTARCIQGIDLRRIDTGNLLKAAARARSGVTHTVFDRLFVQDDGSLGPEPGDTIAVLPALHGVDGFVWRPSHAPALRPGERESWGWLLDPRWAGHVGLIADPVLGIIEAALATEAQLGQPFGDIGNLTIDEVDTIADYLIHKKKIGHFKDTWTSQAEAVRLMRRGSVTIQSLFSPAVSQLRAEGMQLAVADPAEGSRGWHSDLCISAAAEGERVDAAYAYLNWWQNGWAGACLSRQGYYFIFPELARPHLSAAEWDYWYDGQPASEPLCGPSGEVTIREGHRREGGSYRARMASARVWNTFMDEHTHVTRRWQEFLSA